MELLLRKKLNCLQELETTGIIIKTLTFDGAANNLSMTSELRANFQYSELKPYFFTSKHK